MADDRRTKCRICGKRREEVGEISWRGKCVDCGQERLHQAVFNMHDHSGPFFDRWRQGMAACVGLTLLDEPPRVVHGDSRAD